MIGEPGIAPGRVDIHHGDNLAVARTLPDASFTLIYLDPPFNTGRRRERAVESAVDVTATPQESGPQALLGAEPGGPEPLLRSSASGPVKAGFRGREYARLRGDLSRYDDRFEDYWDFLEPRLAEAWRLLADDGTLYVHLDYREVHYAKVMLDALFGRDCFLNEIIWAYDYGGRAKNRWPAKHDNILVYVKNPAAYHFDNAEVDREPYMAPGLVTPEKVALGKLPTDVWWHTIVSPTGREKTGYPTQKPEGLLRRAVAASSREGDWVLDFFAGSGTLGAVAAKLGRRFVCVDANPQAIGVMAARLGDAATVVSAETGEPLPAAGT